MASVLRKTFIKNFSVWYNPRGNLIIGDQLLHLKVRWILLSLFSETKDMCGIKCLVLVYVESKYILNSFLCTSVDIFIPKDEAVIEHLVMRLTERKVET